MTSIASGLVRRRILIGEMVARNDLTVLPWAITGASSSTYRNGVTLWIQEKATKEGARPGTREDSTKTSSEITQCGRQDGKWLQHVTTQCLVEGTGLPRLDLLVERPVVCPTSRMPHNAAYLLCHLLEIPKN